MPFISAAGRAAARSRRQAGALLAAVAAGLAATAPAAPGSAAPGTPYVYVTSQGSGTVSDGHQWTCMDQYPQLITRIRKHERFLKFPDKEEVERQAPATRGPRTAEKYRNRADP